MVATYPSSTNTYVPDHEASGKLVVDFARNVNKFAVNKYVQIVPANKSSGYYLEMTVEQAGRIMNSDDSDILWPDGADAPDHWDGTESHAFKPFATKRRTMGFRMGDKTVDNASWDIVAQHAGITAQQAMTRRTQQVVNVMTNESLYPAGHVLDIPSIPGVSGNWAASTTVRQDIKRSLITGVEKILDSTLAAVNGEDCMLILSSELAGEISMTQEIVDHIKGSPDALAQVRGELPGRNVLHGLPDRLYGIEVIVEATRKVTSAKGKTRVVEKVMPTSTPVLVSRPGGLEGTYGAPSFSTVTIFTEEEMTTETKHDKDNRVTKGRVVEDYVVVMTAPVSGILFKNAA